MKLDFDFDEYSQTLHWKGLLGSLIAFRPGFPMRPLVMSSMLTLLLVSKVARFHSARSVGDIERFCSGCRIPNLRRFSTVSEEKSEEVN